MGAVWTTVRPGHKSLDRLRDTLENLCREYDPSFLESDPLRYAHRFSNPKDRELIAFLSATYAFGNVKAIFGTLDRLLSCLGPVPSETVTGDLDAIRGQVGRIGHRWVTGQDAMALLSAMGEIYLERGNLEALFPAGGSTREGIGAFTSEIRGRFLRSSGRHRTAMFLFPDPARGSALKRMNLFLRWVVRTEAPDLGLWTCLKPHQLYLPLDTHLARIVRYIGLTHRKTADWRMAAEVTKKLRSLNPEDPIRFDFALSRLGILARCRHRWEPSLCPKCPLFSLCTLAAKGLQRRLDRIDAVS